MIVFTYQMLLILIVYANNKHVLSFLIYVKKMKCPCSKVGDLDKFQITNTKFQITNTNGHFRL